MNNTQGQNETSAKEREKLKKRLQTLFKRKEKEHLLTGHSKKNNLKVNEKQNHQPKNVHPVKTTNQMKEKTNEMAKKLPKVTSIASSNSPKIPKQKQPDLPHNSKQKNFNKKHKSTKLSLEKQKKSANSDSSILSHNESKAQPTKKKNSNNKALNSNGLKGQQNVKKKNSKKKAKKRPSTTTISNVHQPKGKKIKLTEKINKTKLQKSEKSPKSESKLKTRDEYDLSNMSGFVYGGNYDSDFNSESDDQQYWMQNGDNVDSNESNYDSSEETVRDLETYGNHKSHSKEEDYFDSDGYDDDDDYASEEEEEEINYSDFNEDDYEEDDDSYDYSFDSDVYSSNYEDNDDDNHDMSYDFEDDDNDGEYNLPSNVPEDLIVHRGTATKYDIKPEDNIEFNSDSEEAQVIELEEQNLIKVIKQPKAYEKDEILKLTFEENTALKTTTLKTTTESATKSSSDSEDCPKLVPIVDEDGFQLYNPNHSEDFMEEDEEEEGSFGSYEDEDDSMDDISLGSEINSDDADSLLSEDINEKYLNRGLFEDSDSSVDDTIFLKQQKVDVIDATTCKYLAEKNEYSKDNSDVSLNDDIQQIPSQKLFAHVDLNTKCSYLSTTIIENNTRDTCKKFQTDTDKCKINTTNSESIDPDQSSDSNALDDIENNDKNANETEADLYKSTNQNFVNYNTTFYNAFDSNLVLVLMKDPFYIYGTVRLTLLAGSLDVYGHNLALNKEVEIFSPRGCSVIEITSSPSSYNKSKDNIKDILKMYEKNFALADLKLIFDSYNIERDAVVLLKRNEGRRKVIQQFQKFMNENVFPNINNLNMDRPLYNAEYLLRCMINTSAQAQKCLRLPTEWQQLHVEQQSRIMLTGGKGVGKSTLLRYLINRNLAKYKQILLIDLDIGQPEIFVPQTVSCSVISQPLLGPGFLLNLQIDKSYVVGHTNIALCAHKYLEAVRSLISHCLKDEKYQELPWLINTMGYNKGFGLELISVIANDLPLTDLIQLQSSKDINNFESILFRHVISDIPRNMFIEEELNNDESTKLDYRLHVLPSAVQQESRYLKEWDMSGKDLRYATLLARLSEALPGHAEWLTDCKPLSAPLDQIKIVNLTSDTVAASQEELTKAIEANLVYLCRYENVNKPLECFGIGIVRGIDFHVRQLYLLPAMAVSLIKHVNCLAIGEMPLPSSLLINQGSRVKNLAPFVYNTIAAKSSKAIKQIYHRPRKFLTGVHKSLE